MDVGTKGEENILHPGEHSGYEGDAVGAEEIRVFEGIVIRVMKEEVGPSDQDGADQREHHRDHLSHRNASSLQYRLEEDRDWREEIEKQLVKRRQLA